MAATNPDVSRRAFSHADADETRAREPARDAARDAIAKLQSLHDGDIGVVETISCGARAVPAVRDILFAREPSGLFETRRRAVEALAGLRAHDVLREFLGTWRRIADPIERTGEDAVINAAARALGALADTADLPLLLALLRRKPYAGVIEAVGPLRCFEALPLFVDALADDFARAAAESAILKLGTRATPALLRTADDRVPRFGREFDSSRQRRRSALRLLVEIGIPSRLRWRPLHRAIDDPDPWISLRACQLCLAGGMTAEKPNAVRRLMELLKLPDSLLIAEIEDVLTARYEIAKTFVADAIESEREAFDSDLPWWQRDKALTVLLRVREAAKRRSAS